MTRFAFWSLGAYALLGTAALLLLTRCDLAEPVPVESLVVETFLETGKPLPTVTLRQTRGLEDPATGTEDAAEGARVTLVLDGDSLAYEPDPNALGQHRPLNTTADVPTGVSFQLDVRWNDVRAAAQGRTPPVIGIRDMCLSVPEAPVEAILVDSVRRDSLDIPAQEGFLYPIEVTVTWSREPEAIDTSYWVRAQLRPSTSLQSGGRVVDFFLQPAAVRREQRFQTVDDRHRWTGVYAVPVDSSDTPLPKHALTADLVRGDSAFADFAASRTDPERRAPVSNVEGALGIATAIALDSLRHVVDRTGDQCIAGTVP